MKTSYAICAVGEGFSVEDRRTGERVGFYHTWAKATAVANAKNALARADKATPVRYPTPEKPIR